MKLLMTFLIKTFRPRFPARLSSSGADGALNSFTVRSHTCGQLRKSDAGRKVKLCGWIQFQRLNKFVLLRDAYGVTQLVTDEQRPDITKKIRDAPLESVIAAEGLVALRPAGQENRKQATGEIEVVLEDFQVLSRCTPNLPFSILDSLKVNEPLRLEHRYLNLRHETLQRNLRLRSEFVAKMREYLVHHGFVDIETPTLFRKTPGGAQEFVVPTRSPGKFYSLVQSPQQFKQLLMVGGFDRYFQIARCYRDESTKPNRQPEFTQVDIEMSFTTKEHIQRLIEGLLSHAWPRTLATQELQTPFPEMSYQDAMTKYGVDKPDTSFDNLLVDVTDAIKESDMSRVFPSTQLHNFNASAAVFNGAANLLSKNDEETLIKAAKGNNAQLSVLTLRVDSTGKWKSSLAKKIRESTMRSINHQLDATDGDLVLLGLGPRESLVPCMGKMRVEMANLLESRGVKMRQDGHHFLWIVDFPLFLPAEDRDDGRIESAHHPFTAPHPDDVHLLNTSPLEVRGLHYDLVLNGSEVGGGSIRIHDPEMQDYVLRDILQEDPMSLHHLLRALKSGAPPHGGIALGLDRLVAILCQTSSIRDVIAFPKSLDGKDLMSGAPSPVSTKDKELYHIQTLERTK